HEDEVPHPDLPEAHAERVDPEVVEALRVARGDVAGDAFVEAEPAEQTERGGEAPLAVAALVLDGVEGREPQRDSIRGHDGILRNDALGTAPASVTDVEDDRDDVGAEQHGEDRKVDVADVENAGPDVS